MPGRATNEPSNYIGFAKQTDKDTEGTTFWFVKHQDGSGFEVDEDVTSEREGGDGQEVGLRYKTAISPDGQVVGNARAQFLGRIAAWTLGCDNPSVTASPLTHHRIIPAATLPYITVEQFWADSVERSSANQFTGFQLEAESGGAWKVTANFISGGSVYERPAASALTPSRETGRPLFFPGGSYVIEGAGNTKVTKIKVGAARAVDADIRTTGLNREDVVPLNQDYDVDFTLKYEDRTLYRKVKYNSGSQINIPYLSTGAFAMHLFAQPSFPFQLLMPFIEYVGARVNKLDPDGKTMYLDVAAMTLKSGTYPMSVGIVTDETTAY